jgi:SAM-dependent methyltransferase
MKKMAEIPSTKPHVRELILRSIGAPYVSESCHNGIKTGNNYQSLTLDDVQTTGFRTPRAEFLDRIEFRGKRVLDLGSNFGELSRAARARGAAFVDGIEQDRYFLEIANLVNAYNGVTRVSFHHGDITSPNLYSEHYDIVLAFSVFTYLRSVLDRIAGITDQVLILETHKLEDNLETAYLAPVREYFPHYHVLGESEWGRPFDEREKRAVIVFAKERAALDAALRVEQCVAGVGAQADSQARAGDSLSADVSRTCLQQQFFSMFDCASTTDLFAAVGGLEIDVDAISRLLNSARDYDGWLYWLLFLRGYLQYAQEGTLGKGNVYCDYLTKYYVERGRDPTMRREFANPDAIIGRVKRRFRDLDAFCANTTDGMVRERSVAPVRATISDPAPRHPLLIYVDGATEPLLARRIDGWHRLFAARVCGLRILPLEVVHEEHALDAIQGRVERFALDGQELQIQGWVLHHEQPIQGVEVRLDAETVAITRVVDRPDVGQAFPDIPHARRSGFSVRCACRYPDAEPAVLQVLGLSDWLPVGSLSADYRRDRQDELLKSINRNGARTLDGGRRSSRATTAPPVEARKTSGDPRTPPARQSTESAASSCVAPAGPRSRLPAALLDQDVPNVIEVISPDDIQYRAYPNLPYYMSVGQSALRCVRLAMLAARKESFETILDLPSGHGRVLRTFKAAFPTAQITACDLDRDAVDFCAATFGAVPVYSHEQPERIELHEVFDLVWCGSLLTHLDQSRWAGFLARFESLLAPGGILLFTTHGRFVAERLRRATHSYGLTPDAIGDVLAGYDRDGFGYADYASQAGYGISLSSPAWVTKKQQTVPNLRLLSFTEQGWNRHQDVIACVRD